MLGILNDVLCFIVLSRYCRYILFYHHRFEFYLYFQHFFLVVLNNKNTSMLLYAFDIKKLTRVIKSINASIYYIIKNNYQ